MEKNRLFCNKCLADWDKYLIYDYNKADQILHNRTTYHDPDLKTDLQ